MLTMNKRIWTNIVSTMLITALILSGLFSFPNASYGTTTYTTYETTTYYRLDTGVTFLWKNSAETWQNGWEPGDSVTYSRNITIPENVKNVISATYDEDADFGETGYFPFESENGIGGDCIIWNTTDIADTKTEYDTYYNAFTAYPLSASGDYTSSVGNLEITYDATFSAHDGADYDVKAKLAKGEAGKQEIIALLGSPSAELTEAMDLMNPESENYNSNVEGYLYFLPVVIKYDIVEAVEHTINGFEPGLDVPRSAKAGEEYTVTDTTEFEDDSEFTYSYLYYSVDGGTKEKVKGWKGTTLGESIKLSFEDVCTVTYTLTVWNKYGEDKSVSKSIDITDDREITVNADLTLPDYTFEGHTELAQDKSTFDVNGVPYSATRAYAEDIASNSFKCSSSYVDINKMTDTKAECTFEKTGTYSVNLKIKTCTGGTAADTETIEVRKTPYIIDSLSGFQKQNRKQILNIAVATYPGKPITDYDITLKDAKTGNSFTLSPDNLQENNATVKTRTVQRTDSEDGCFTYLTVEFLTKTPSYFSTGTSPQDFYYQINVEDSKGDTDTKSKTFAVSPDLPPTAAISLDSAFLRNEGINIATIKAEDITVAKDGDSVARTWYYGATTAPYVYTDVSTMGGYQKLSFGTDKIVGFNKVGVGKFTTKLFVKEVWTEPTLEEYITDADHLTGTVTAFSDVQNVAPIVSLELLNGIEKDVLLIANNDAEYQTLFNNKTALKQALLANKIDANIIIKKLIGNTPTDVTGITPKLSYTFPTTYWTSGVEMDRNAVTVDSEKVYFTTWTLPSNQSYAPPATVHAYNPYAGEVWQYTTNGSEVFELGNDDVGKYLYLLYSNKTVLLDKRTGAVAGTINIKMPSHVIATDHLFFTLESNTLYAIDQNSLVKTQIDTGAYSVSRVGGNLEYITLAETGVIKNTLDINKFTITRELLIDTTNGKGGATCYVPACIDSSGKTVLFKAYSNGTDTFKGVRIYSPDNNLIKEISITQHDTYGIKGNLSVYAPLDENGESHHIIAHYEDASTSPNTHYLIGINLDNNSSALFLKQTGDLNGMSLTAFQSKGVTYMYNPGWCYSGSARGLAYVFTYNGSTIGYDYSGPGMIGYYDEVFSASDRIMTSSLGDNSTNATLKLQISAFPKTLIQETKELIGKFSNKFTFVGNVNTTAEQIKAAVDATKQVVKVTANNNGSLSLNGLSLAPGKKYYYEYDVKPLTDGTKGNLTGITSYTPTSTTNQPFIDTLYVENSYKEDFNDSNINKFFTVTSLGNEYYGKCGPTLFYGQPSNLSMSFTVPANKKAIVSFDYDFCFYANGWSSTNIFIDGLRMDENPTISPNYETYWIKTTGHKVFYKVLEPGVHTVEVRDSVAISYFNYAYIDNLVVDILSGAPKISTPTYDINPSEEKNWYSINGTFYTPSETLSYGAQQSYTYYGGLPAAVTETYTYRNTDYTRTIEYYETIPNGYLQKGYAHLGSTYLYNTPNAVYTINGGGQYEYRSDGTVDNWVFTGVKSAGTYTHIAKNTKSSGPRYYQVYIDGFKFVTYPDNAVTQTGNMAFNSANTELFFPKESSGGTTNLNMYIPKGEYLIKNLRVYYIESGQKIYLENKALEDITQLPNWTLSSGLTASKVTDQVEKNDDEYVKIYKKGERVLYNIFYDDYEEDPSKTGYWVYAHVPWPPDTLYPDVGKILTAPIDRFYLSGKYTVTHWEVDNTQRTGTVGDATPYNKESNKVTMTFYVDGEGKAPWVTYIKTNPQKVKENNAYTLAIGVDDTEKDVLQLMTEVYLNGRNIFADMKTGIAADAAGNYPEQTITGLPTAKAGIYQVICTVSDYSGTGIKAYKFTVVSEGRVTGSVYHTEQWDENRKKYNLKRFSDEVGRALSLGDYLAMSTPRMRGTNVFWSGEKFMLRAETEGEPTSVTAQLLSAGPGGGLVNTGYSAVLNNTGRKTSAGAEIWEGSLWSAAMINKWGMKAPEELTFLFTADYTGSVTKTHTATVILDSERDYWQIHRLW